ncbi:ABC transporter ATP-binding protein [Chelatococcus reniformis]|uniref:ABC transporter ATP-binding protein n=1 Tax=Chelatococcus reniformis TaxID=1494448 RepID=A0A916XF98_9HYPH|nr:ABC transporter ATP-binding protein [Chelatococcus reniformis]GGC66310.1 ABC transporter ATP-binding protein [Chelatococcus reniformis]
MQGEAAPPLLSVQAIEAGYIDGVRVLDGISLEVGAGEIVTLLGRNGAGKSTVIRVVCGLLKPGGGRVRFGGADITGADPAAIVQGGIAVVPEGRRVFASLSVEENLTIGGFAQRRSFIPRPSLERIYTAFPRLAERRGQRAGTLSGGEQQMLAMGRALMAEPRLLLLDEPSMGLAPMLIEQVFDMVNTLAMAGMTILLVEQNASAALDIADRAYVLERGRIVRAGAAAVLQSDPDIRASYLGVD